VGSYRNALGPQVYAPARGPVYYARPGFRGGYAYRGARYGYRGVGYYGPRYRYGYYGPRYGYGYPYYRRSNGGAVAAGLIGGLALGAIAANAARPVYYQRPVYADCWVERRRAYTRRGNVVIRSVRVCN
jgi:hypothetical protein